MNRVQWFGCAVLACLFLAFPAWADTYATSLVGGYQWTDGPNTWGLGAGCYPDNGNGMCGDGRWFVTLEHIPNITADITLTGLSNTPLYGGLSGGAVTMTVEEQFAWYSGNIFLTGGTLHLLPGCVSSLAGGWNGTAILNQGTMLQTNFIRNSGTITNDVGAVWEVNLSADNYFVWDGSGSIINKGLLRKTGPASTYPYGIDTFHVTSTGELRVEEGTFTIYDSSSSGWNLILDGQLEVNAGAVAVIGRPVTFGSTAKVGGAGTVRFNTGNDTTTVLGTWNVTGLTEIKTGNVTFTSPCVTNDFSQCYGTLTGDVTINGNGFWSDGIMGNPGTTWLNGDMTIDSSVNCGFAAPMALDDRTLQLAAGSQLLVVQHGPNGDNGAVIAIPSGATMMFDTPSDYRVMGATVGGGAIENDGFIMKSGPGRMYCSWLIDNHGDFLISQGDFTTQDNGFGQTAGETHLGGGSLSSSAGPLDIQGGRLTGGGNIGLSIVTDVDSSGTIAPGPGFQKFDILGTLNLGAGSRLEFDLGSAANPIPGVDNDAIVSRFATIDGELHVTILGTPDAAAEYVVLQTTIGDVLGSFTNVANGNDLEEEEGRGVFTVYYGAGSAYPPDQVVLTNFRELCRADTNGDGVVNVVDLLALLADWGPCPGACQADIDRSGAVDVLDLLEILANWGTCP